MKTERVLSPAGTSAQRMLRRIAHIEFTDRDDIWRDLAAWCEQRGDRRHYSYSTVIFEPFSRCKFPANLTELEEGIEAGRAQAYDEWMDGPSYEDAASEAFESEQDSIDAADVAP